MAIGISSVFIPAKLIKITVKEFKGGFIQYTATGIASTIMSISRIIIIPVSIMIFYEKVTKTEILGAFISILGVGILFL